jgi:hypothetical protein
MRFVCDSKENHRAWRKEKENVEQDIIRQFLTKQGENKEKKEKRKKKKKERRERKGKRIKKSGGDLDDVTSRNCF